MRRVSRNVVITWLKIIIAAGCGILIAHGLGLEFATSAGTIAILTIQPTKRETINTALGRLCAFIAAMIISYVSFRLFGFTLCAFFIYLIPYIFICQVYKWYSAMAMNSVLISHFVTQGTMGPAAVRNEVLLFSLGVGIGILANLHLHKRVETIERLMAETDEQIIEILLRMSERILNREMVDDNEERFLVLKKHMEEAKEVAEENYNNQFASGDIYDMEYLVMRDKQCLVLYEMYKTVRLLETTPLTAQQLSEFLNTMAAVFQRGNNGRDVMEEFRAMDLYMKSQPLPVERKEFEDRARLFALMRNIEEFILIKMEFADRFS